MFKKRITNIVINVLSDHSKVKEIICSQVRQYLEKTRSDINKFQNFNRDMLDDILLKDKEIEHLTEELSLMEKRISKLENRLDMY